MFTKKEKLNVNSIALAGEFFTLAQLALRGFDANMTLGHTKSVDILVSNPKTGKMSRLEVKTTNTKLQKSKLFGTNYQWMMSKKHESILDKDLFYCFVILSGEIVRYFIIPSKIVAKYVMDEHKLWIKQDSTHKSGEMRMFRIGSEKDSHGLEINKWENRFDLLA